MLKSNTMMTYQLIRDLCCEDKEIHMAEFKKCIKKNEALLEKIFELEKELESLRKKLN